jgi:hypothetical protein
VKETSMTEGDDLPDGDYESIYGREALHARVLAQLEAILHNQERLLGTLRTEARDQEEA